MSGLWKTVVSKLVKHVLDLEGVQVRWNKFVEDSFK